MNNKKQIYDNLIIGSGPAGLTAAIYNARASLKTVVIAGSQPGGQLTITTFVDNFPGFVNGIGGVKLMMDMQQQTRNLGVEILSGVVKNVRHQASNTKNFEIELENGEVLEAKSVIVATGASVKWLGLLKEKELIGHGISGCATCDGMFFRGKKVAVVGGGDTACEEANFLSKICEKVYLIHRRGEFRAAIAEQNKVLNNPKVEILWNSEIIELNPPALRAPSLEKGGQNTKSLSASAASPFDEREKLNSIKVINTKTNEGKILPLDGLFLAIGSSPSTNFLKGLVDLTETGQVLVGKNLNLVTMTNIEGVFAAGDCVNIKHKQAIVAAGEGCRAALDAESWLNSKL